MTRLEMMTIIRERLPEQLNMRVGDAQLRSLVNQAMRGMTIYTRQGEETSDDLTVGSDGTVTLPTALIRLTRVEYNGNQVKKTSMGAITNLEEASG